MESCDTSLLERHDGIGRVTVLQTMPRSVSVFAAH